MAHSIEGRDELDLGLVARVRSGDVEAFQGLVLRWQGPLVNLAFRFCRDRAQAEDMAQDAFLRAFRALPGFRGQSAFSTWLIALAVNTYRSHLRRRQPASILLAGRGRPGELADLEAALAPPATPGVDDLLTREREEEVRSEVARLPERYREAIVLFYFEERNVEEAARVLGVPAGTLKARLHRGRKLLRQRLEGRVAARATREAEAGDTPAGRKARE